MDPSYQIQKQVKDNAEDVRSFISDLNNWSGKVNSESLNSKDPSVQEMPPIRNCSKKRESNDEASGSSGSKVTKRIPSSDYAQWEKYDVEEACKEVDSAEAAEGIMKLRDKAYYEKEIGNRHVKNQKWDDAIMCYSKAIKCYPKDATFYANRALCYLKKKQYPSVEADCTSALQLEPGYVKALQRRATARRELNQLEDALQDLNKALSSEPNNSALKADIAAVRLKMDPRGASKPVQGNDPLKWVPPVKKEVSSPKTKETTSSSSLPTKSREASPAPSFPAPVVITPAKKHLKGGQVSVGEEDNVLKANPKPQKSDPQKSEPQQKPKRDNSTVSLEKAESPKQPIKWYHEEGTSVVSPIIKLPHRRSKAPLKPMWIKECPNYNLKADLQSKENKENKTSVEEDIKCGDEVTQNENLKIEKLEIQPQVDVSVDGDEIDLPVPSTSVQFIADWKLIQKKPQLCYKFLKKIPGGDFPKIFQECLESDLFSGIIDILQTKFIDEGVPVYDYLVGLSKVRRFNMLTMFMSPADKRGIVKLFEYCQTKEGLPVEAINDLKKAYEL